MNPNHVSPASPAEAKGALIALFEAFPADRGEGSAAVATYLIAIDGYSLKAIQGAVKRLIRGEIHDVDKRFLPTPAQLSNAVAYMEKLYAPPEPRLALPAPGDIRDDSPEGIARREAFVAKVRERFGIKSHKGETVVETPPRTELLLQEAHRFAVYDAIGRPLSNEIEWRNVPVVSAKE